MEFNEFINYVKEHLFDNCPKTQEKREVKVISVKKNNGLVLTGLSVCEEQSNVAPTVYLEAYFEEYKKGKSLNSIISEVLFTCERGLRSSMNGFDAKKLEHFENVENCIGARLINGPKNEERLLGLPHFKYGDLALIFHISIVMDENVAGTVTVTNELMNSWRVEPAKLLETALANMQRNDFGCICNIETMLLEMFSHSGRPDISQEAIETLKERASRKTDAFGMYVLTNRTRVNGAASLIEPGLLENFANTVGTDVYVLPSSIHECILLPDTGETTVEELKRMVKEVNTTQVLPEEVLSDNVYFYERATGCLVMAETGEKLVLYDVSKGFTFMYTPATDVSVDTFFQ